MHITKNTSDITSAGITADLGDAGRAALVAKLEQDLAQARSTAAAEQKRAFDLDQLFRKYLSQTGNEVAADGKYRKADRHTPCLPHLLGRSWEREVISGELRYAKQNDIRRQIW